MSAVLLIGSRQDPHVAAVSQCVQALGHCPLVCDSGSLAAVSIRISDTSRPSAAVWAEPGCPPSPLDQLSAVWLRQKPVVPLPSWGPFERAAAEFTQTEWRTVLHSLEDCCKGARWVNDPQAQATINYKPRQLALATRIGLEIPSTVITNCPREVRRLLDASGRIIYKSLNWYTFPDHTGILTTEITETQLIEQEDAIRRAPGIYQEFLEKHHELRITIVGDHVFPALIRTPTDGPAATDWRHAHFDQIFERCEISEALSSRLLAFQRAAGLRFGTYDLVVDPRGRQVFLECNPAGQYLWLEHSLGLEISAALAAELCGQG